MNTRRVPILVYHHVYPDETMSNVSESAGIIGESELRRQLQYIVDEGWTAVSTDQILDWLVDSTVLPAKAVAVHFDNGWQDTRTVAMPILQEFGMAGMCYVITDGLQAASRGAGQAVRTLTEGVVEKPFMTWGQAEELLDAGWEIGAHTATHCKMADKHADDGDEGVLREITMSNALIRQRLGFVPAHFAYPSGSRTADTDRLVAPHYRSLRLWHAEWPIVWRFTDLTTSPQAIECQNVDSRVPWADFARIFSEASAG